MLAHFYQPDDDRRVSEAIMGDWIEALAGHSQETISKAVKDYLLNDKEGRRPTIGVIASLCRKHTPPMRVVPKETPAEKRERVTPARRAEIVRKAGIKSPVLRNVLAGEGLAGEGEEERNKR